MANITYMAIGSWKGSQDAERLMCFLVISVLLCATSLLVRAEPMCVDLNFAVDSEFRFAILTLVKVLWLKLIFISVKNNFSSQ